MRKVRILRRPTKLADSAARPGGSPPTRPQGVNPSSRARDLRVALFPPPKREVDSYLSLLQNALQQSGVECVHVPALTPGWVRVANTRVDVVHLHWLEFLAPSDRTRGLGLLKTAVRATRLAWMVRELRRRGVPIVWTVHNLAPHESVHPRIERALARTVLGMADRAIVHSEYAWSRVAARMRHDEKLQVIPHGNYLNVYPPAERTRDDLRNAYGLARDAFVYLSFGQIRRYKCLPDLVRAFQAVPGEVALLIAGEPRDEGELARLRALAGMDARVHLDLRRIPPSEVASIHAASDAAVFPYHEMFSSGSALLALSFGLPIVVPAQSTGTEIVSNSGSVPIGPDGLTAALNAVRQGDRAVRRQLALAAAQRYDWKTVGCDTAELYRLVRDQSRRKAAASPAKIGR